MPRKRASLFAELLPTLEARFERFKERHRRIAWPDVAARLEGRADRLEALAAMEQTGGEPDVVGVDKRSGELLFIDCCAETPAGRRNLCYDAQALAERKQAKPRGSAVETAAAMGIELVGEAEYRALQQLGEFDTRTSSWILTPPAIRSRGGALFMDRRYDHVFVYHNGAQSYYSARGFRGLLRV